PVLHVVRVSFVVAVAHHQISALSLHDALPIYGIGIELGYGPIVREDKAFESANQFVDAFESFVETVCKSLGVTCIGVVAPFHGRSEEHTSELQSRENLVCRLLLEKNNRSNKEY